MENQNLHLLVELICITLQIYSIEYVFVFYLDFSCLGINLIFELCFFFNSFSLCLIED